MPRPVLIVSLCAFMYMLGLSVIFPVLPQFVRSLGLTETDAGILVSSYALASFLMAPLWGRFSEVYGRKPALLIGMAGFSVAFLCFGLGSTFGTLLAARGLGGMVAAAAMPALFAHVSDSSHDDRRAAAMGMVGASIGLGILGGVLIGGLLGSLNLRLPFYATAGIGALSMLAVWIGLPESLTPALREEQRTRRLELTSRGWTVQRAFSALAPFLGFSFLVQASRSGLEVTIGFLVIDRFGGDAADTGILLGAGTACGILMQAGGVRALSGRFSDRTLMQIGTLVMALGLAVTGAVQSWGVLFVAAVCFGLGLGLFEPTFRAELSRAGDLVQGEAQGANSSAQSLARAVSYFAFPWLYARVSPEAVFGVAALLSLVALMVAQLGLHRRAAELPARAADLERADG